MSLVTITATEDRPPARHREWCEQLEAGSILFFPRSPIALSDSDLQFLRGQQQTDSSLHKNIAYKPKADELTGVDSKTANPAAVQPAFAARYCAVDIRECDRLARTQRPCPSDRPSGIGNKK
jgi:hypothetical protein